MELKAYNLVVILYKDTHNDIGSECIEQPCHEKILDVESTTKSSVHAAVFAETGGSMNMAA